MCQEKWGEGTILRQRIKSYVHRGWEVGSARSAVNPAHTFSPPGPWNRETHTVFQFRMFSGIGGLIPEELEG